MPINKPTIQEIENSIVSEFCNTTGLPSNIVNESREGIVMKATSIATGSLYDYTEQNILHATNYENYYGDALDILAGQLLLNRRQNQPASGMIFIQGDLDVFIPKDTSFIYKNYIYVSTQDYYIIENSINIVNISRNGTIATITTASNHNLSSGAIVSIISTEINFNRIDVPISVIDYNKFTIVVDNTGATDVYTGILKYNGTNINIYCTTNALDTNIPKNTTLELASFIDNLTLISTDINGLSGGADLETDTSLRNRLYEKTRNNVAYYSINGLPIYIKNKYPNITHIRIVDGFLTKIPIISISKDIAYGGLARIVLCSGLHGFTKINDKFYSITGASHNSLNLQESGVSKIIDDFTFMIYVDNEIHEDITSQNMQLNPFYEGNGTIFLYKANDVNTILSYEELFNIKQDILNNIYPAFASTNFTIQNLNLKQHNITFTALNPNIPSIKKVIINNLINWSKDLDINKRTISARDYLSIIDNTRDENRNTVISYTLSNENDINLDIDEILVLSSQNIIFNI